MNDKALMTITSRDWRRSSSIIILAKVSALILLS
jgi:hypothetical protein